MDSAKKFVWITVVTGLFVGTLASVPSSDIEGAETSDHLEGDYSLMIYHPVRRKPIGWATTPGFEDFHASGFSTDLKKDIVLGTYWSAPPRAVEYVFLFSAGQQTLGMQAATTGQKNGYNVHFRVPFVYRDFTTFKKQSMAGHIIHDRYFEYNGNNTLLIQVFKPYFQIELFKPEKNAMVEGYFNWIKALTDNFKNVKLVYLVGGSRGGVLVTRLGRMIRRHTDNSKTLILISSLDGVPAENQGEIGSTNTWIDNPESDNVLYGAYYTKLDEFFAPSDRKNLFLYQTAGGDPVMLQHAFCFGPKQGAVDSDDYLGFYTQRWVKGMSHTDIVNEWSSPDHPARYHLDWFKQKAKTFLLPPCTKLGGTCQASCVEGAQWEDRRYSVNTYYQCDGDKCCMSKSCRELGGMCAGQCDAVRQYPADYYANGNDPRYGCVSALGGFITCCMPRTCSWVSVQNPLFNIELCE